MIVLLRKASWDLLFLIVLALAAVDSGVSR